MLRTLRTRVGRAHRDIEQQIGKVPQQAQAKLKELLSRTKRILTQKSKGKSKFYPLPPQVGAHQQGKSEHPMNLV